jgi:hypothetical protein
MNYKKREELKNRREIRDTNLKKHKSMLKKYLKLKEKNKNEDDNVLPPDAKDDFDFNYNDFKVDIDINYNDVDPDRWKPFFVESIEEEEVTSGDEIWKDAKVKVTTLPIQNRIIDERRA